MPAAAALAAAAAAAATATDAAAEGRQPTAAAATHTIAADPRRANRSMGGALDALQRPLGSTEPARLLGDFFFPPLQLWLDATCLHSRLARATSGVAP